MTRDKLEAAYNQISDILAKTNPTVFDVGDLASAYEAILRHYLHLLGKRRSQ